MFVDKHSFIWHNSRLKSVRGGNKLLTAHAKPDIQCVRASIVVTTKSSILWSINEDYKYEEIKSQTCK